MKIINETNWDTKDLKKLFNKVIDDEGYDKRYLKILVLNKRKNSSILGKANHSYNRIKLFLKKDYMNVPELSATLIHEIAHLRGVDHKEMMGDHIIQSSMGEQYKDFVINKKAIIEESKPDLQLIRYDKAKARLLLYQSKLKRIANIVRKYKIRVNYYEKQFVLNGKKMEIEE